jgi:dihydroorotate dehydrogenase (NAD+) catalytic subunit
MADLSVRVGSLSLRNPVMPASGCFAVEYSEALDFSRLGALVIKSVSPKSRSGNPTPRVAEVRGGMLNSIGIPSKGLAAYLQQVLPAYLGFGTPVVVSLSADTVAEFAAAVQVLSRPGVAAIEANISCPNLEADGMAFAMQARSTHDAISAMRRSTTLPLWAKLTPNAGDVAAIARAAEAAGADAIVMGNTALGMAIDVRTRRPLLGSGMGGLSGPALKPIALRMTYQCARAVRIPVIGCGGISTAEDAVEFMLAGATAVQVGTASFLDPGVMHRITDGLQAYCEAHGVERAADLVGAVEMDGPDQQAWREQLARLA